MGEWGGGGSPVNRASLMLLQATAPFQRPQGQLSSCHTFRRHCFPSYCRRVPGVISCKGRAIKKRFHLYFLHGPPSGNIFYLATSTKRTESSRRSWQVYGGFSITPISHFHPNLHQGQVIVTWYWKQDWQGVATSLSVPEASF